MQHVNAAGPCPVDPPVYRQEVSLDDEHTRARFGGWAWAALAVSLSLVGCSLAPGATRTERERAEAAGRPYSIAAGRRSLPPLSSDPTWPEVLERAFAANGELEAAYFEWRAALARVDQAAAYPNTNVSLDFEYMFSGENLKSWDRSTFRLGFDPMQNLSFPAKVVVGGRIALDEARAAGERFSALKFEVQRRVLSAYWDWVLLSERLRFRTAEVDVLRLRARSAAAQIAAGGNQVDFLEAEVELRLAENEFDDLRAELPARRAELNAIMGRRPDAHLPLPGKLPKGRDVPAGDAELLAAAVDRNPELAALAHQVAGRRDALELARLQYIPDINPFAGFTGSVAQVAGAALSIPATIPRIRAGIGEARASLRASEAMLDQARRDRAARFVAELAALRNNERQADRLTTEIVPFAEGAVSSLRASYEAGSAKAADLVDAERLLLELRIAIAEAHASREKHLAELEALAGLDVETLSSGVVGGRSDG